MMKLRKRQAHLRGRAAALLRQTRGTSIVELIITFLLIVIFTTGTVRLMADSMRIYDKIRLLNHSQQVMDTLLDKITGEIEGAQVNMRGKKAEAEGSPGGESEESQSPATLTISADRGSIQLYDRTSSSITISQKNKKHELTDEVIIHYDAVKGNGTEGNSGEETYKAVDWRFDPSVYMGFQVQALRFELAGEDYPGNVIKVTLTLSRGDSRTFTNTRYVECYNFETDLDMKKIVQLEEAQPPGG